MKVADVQPQLLPSLTAISSDASPPESSAAPPQSIFAGVFTGDSGMKRWVAIVAGMTTISASQKIHS